MFVRRFKLYKPSELDQLGEALCSSLQTFSADWLTIQSICATPTNVDDPVNEEDGDDVYSDTYWRVISESLAIARNSESGFARMLLPADESPGSVAEELRERVLLTYLGSLSAALDPAGSEEQEAAPIDCKRSLYKGSGAFLVRLRINGLSVEILMGPRIAVNILGSPTISGPRPQLPTLREAMTDQCVSLRAELGSTTLTIGDIKQLAAGDVVALDRSFAQKMILRASSGKVLAHADLGALQGKKALRILAPSSNK